MAIEEIKAGDTVIATDEETGETTEKEVVRVFVNEAIELVHLTVNGETITSTPGHKYYAPEKGWTSAIDLRAGDILVLSNGEYVTVEKVEYELLETPVTIYNFEVEDFHTYYVGEQSVLVHNADCGGGSMLGANGTQVTSKTTWQNGKTERIDVENPAPGERPGQVHYHDSNNDKYYYDIENNTFYDQKTGELAPKAIQKLLKQSDFMKGIKKALKVLGV